MPWRSHRFESSEKTEERNAFLYDLADKLNVTKYMDKYNTEQQKDFLFFVALVKDEERKSNRESIQIEINKLFN